MYLTLLNLLCSSISLISGQITYPDMCWSRCGRITEVGLYLHRSVLLCLIGELEVASILVRLKTPYISRDQQLMSQKDVIATSMRIRRALALIQSVWGYRPSGSQLIISSADSQKGINAFHCSARRALTPFNDDRLRTRRALLP